jgi:hypothetical protein
MGTDHFIDRMSDELQKVADDYHGQGCVAGDWIVSNNGHHEVV